MNLIIHVDGYTLGVTTFEKSAFFTSHDKTPGLRIALEIPFDCNNRGFIYATILGSLCFSLSKAGGAIPS